MSNPQSPLTASWKMVHFLILSAVYWFPSFRISSLSCFSQSISPPSFSSLSLSRSQFLHSQFPHYQFPHYQIPHSHFRCSLLLILPKQNTVLLSTFSAFIFVQNDPLFNDHHMCTMIFSLGELMKISIRIKFPFCWSIVDNFLFFIFIISSHRWFAWYIHLSLILVSQL